MNYIASNLRFLRKLAGLSQEQFAKRVAMNRGNIASYEKGNAEPNIAKLQRIVEYFNVDLVAFIEIDLSKQISPNADEEGQVLPSNLLLNSKKANLSAAYAKLNHATKSNTNPQPIAEVLLPDAIQGLQSMQLYQWQLSNQLSANTKQVEQNLQQLNQTLNSMLKVQQELLVMMKKKDQVAEPV